MGKYKDSDWYIKSSEELIKKYGNIRLPGFMARTFIRIVLVGEWVAVKTHIMVLNEWMDQKALNFDDRLKYLQKYPPPARWYQWIIHFLWEVDSYEFEDADYIPYFEKLEKFGFNNTSEFFKDFNREDLD